MQDDEVYTGDDNNGWLIGYLIEAHDTYTVAVAEHLWEGKLELDSSPELPWRKTREEAIADARNWATRNGME